MGNEIIKFRLSDHGLRNALILGTKADIWRVDCIGEGAFREAVRVEITYYLVYHSDAT